MTWRPRRTADLALPGCLQASCTQNRMIRVHQPTRIMYASIRAESAFGVVSPGVAPSNSSPTVTVAVYLAGWPIDAHAHRGAAAGQASPDAV
jgi:hypothetical protein